MRQAAAVRPLSKEQIPESRLARLLAKIGHERRERRGAREPVHLDRQLSRPWEHLLGKERPQSFGQVSAGSRQRQIEIAGLDHGCIVSARGSRR
jgi:hypothetical protein